MIQNLDIFQKDLKFSKLDPLKTGSDTGYNIEIGNQQAFIIRT